MYIKDIIDRNSIRNNKELLDILIDFISSAIGSLTNPLKLSNRYASEKKINISNNTISKYFSTPLKYYFADMGLRNARLNFRQIEQTHIMENIVYNDLLRRGFSVDVGIVEHFLMKMVKLKEKV